MAHTAQQNDYPLFDPSMRGSFVVSGLFHLTIFLLTITSLPYFMKPPSDTIIPISVEVVDIDKITQTNRVAAPVEKIDKKDEPPPKPARITPPEATETPPPVPVPTPPDVTQPKVSELAPPDKAKPDEKLLKPAPKKPVPKTAEKKKDEPKDFNSLLKDLTPAQKAETKPQENLKDVLASVTEKAETAPLGDRLTMSEIDAIQSAVNAKLRPCWYVQSGAKNAEDIAVEVRVIVNPDRTVQQATIINQLLYNTDSFYRASADAARRALLDPRCAPLPLPADKYEQWKDIDFNFNPKDML